MPSLDLTFASGESSLSVSRFAVHEGVSGLFTVSIWALSDDPSIDLDTIVGRWASFRAESGSTFSPLGGVRLWFGVCSAMRLAKGESAGKSTYQLTIVPRMWLLTQRRGYRIFQHVSIPDIVDQILAEWNITPDWRITRGNYPLLEYKVQYGESDHAFLSRLLEEAGIAYTFPEDGVSSELTLDDQLHAVAPRAAPPLLYTDNPSGHTGRELCTEVRLGHDVRPGAHAIRDFDLRNPGFALLGEASRAPAPEDRYEQFEYQPGGFLQASTGAVDTPAADDKGPYRHDQSAGRARAQRALDAERVNKRAVSFRTNTVDLWPGVVFSIGDHPHPELPVGAGLLVTEFFVAGSPGDEWHMSGNAVFASVPYRPPQKTPKPQIGSVQSATVVGPFGQEIHTDEFGRVRVQFPWDRQGLRNDHSSTWMRVSQAWAGTGYGGLHLPRVGEEVLVGFLGGDPEQPVVVGRLFNTTNPVPYKLPENKTRNDWKSNTSPGSDGWNEIMQEDLAGSELVYQQAQKNLRRLVKHDEIITVGHDREKLIVKDETDTTTGKRFEETDKDRTEEDLQTRTTAVKKKLRKLVKKDEIERTLGGQIDFVGRDRHIIVEKIKREHDEHEVHLKVEGCRNESVGGASLSTGSLQVKVGKKDSLETGLALHEKAGTVFVGEGVSSVTIKGPGGFITIGPGGVDIVGTLVLINAGGSPGSALDACPGGPEDPREAKVTVEEEPPPPPLIDPDVTIGRVMRGNPYVESNADPADGMVDSVPPTKTYEVEVTIDPQLEPGRFIELTIVHGSAANGSASVTPRQINTTTTVTVTGGAQTRRGHAGQLKIRATLDGATKAESDGFTVCAHPINLHNRFSADVNGGGVMGTAVTVAWDSDSDTFADLNQAEFSEEVRRGHSDVPPFQNYVDNNSHYLAANLTGLADTHSTYTPSAGPAGELEFIQVFIFKCHRCGVVDKVQPNSGLHILHRVFLSHGNWTHSMRKFGVRTTIGAWTSEAGDCNVQSPDHPLH